ncbi:MAG TPA: hypothetical protein VE110_07575 [Gemmatimonadaceae bacterium]|jgi:hypothetical protein|nr:hypothetical protein [Gemmatimonadaceae bacterium]
MTDRNRERQADIPTGTDEMAGEKARSDNAAEKKAKESDSRDQPNPPRTSKGNFTAPKFGSATSGGAELEPGPERD